MLGFAPTVAALGAADPAVLDLQPFLGPHATAELNFGLGQRREGLAPGDGADIAGGRGRGLGHGQAGLGAVLDRAFLDQP